MSVLQSLCEWGDQKCQQLWNKHWPWLICQKREKKLSPTAIPETSRNRPWDGPLSQVVAMSQPNLGMDVSVTSLHPYAYKAWGHSVYIRLTSSPGIRTFVGYKKKKKDPLLLLFPYLWLRVKNIINHWERGTQRLCLSTSWGRRSIKPSSKDSPVENLYWYTTCSSLCDSWSSWLIADSSFLL